MLSAEQLVELLEASLLDVNAFLVAEVLAAWNGFNPRGSTADFTADVMPVALGALIEAQEFGAEISGDHVADMAEAAGTPAGSVIDPKAFSGIASDGRNLAALLVSPLIAARKVGVSGGTVQQMSAVGAQSFETIASTQMYDASRAAQKATQVATRSLVGYARKVEAGACDRCMVLSGRIYRWSQGFDRHPRCKCTMSEVFRGDDTGLPSPEELFRRLPAAEQDSTFGADSAQAIRDGADISAVVNAKRKGMSVAGADSVTPGVKFTLEGSTRRGFYAQQRRAIDRARGVETAEVRSPNALRRKAIRRVAAPRLMPGQIYKLAGDDRDEAVRLLAGNGYIVGDLAEQAERYIAQSAVPVPLG